MGITSEFINTNKIYNYRMW